MTREDGTFVVHVFFGSLTKSGTGNTRDKAKIRSLVELRRALSNAAWEVQNEIRKTQEDILRSENG
jgi:hypothetical protein